RSLPGAARLARRVREPLPRRPQRYAPLQQPGPLDAGRDDRGRQPRRGPHRQGQRLGDQHRGGVPRREAPGVVRGGALLASRTHWKKFLLGLALASAILFLLLRRVDPQAVWLALRAADWPWLAVVTALGCGSIFLKGERWAVAIAG